MGELDFKESWAPKNWWFLTVVLVKTFVILLNCKEIQPVHSEGDQPWDFFGRNDAEAETPILWPPHVKSWLIGKDSDAGRDWRYHLFKFSTRDNYTYEHHQMVNTEIRWIMFFAAKDGKVLYNKQKQDQELTVV